MMMCSRCQERPAVVFVSQSANADQTQGYCLNCAKELGIKPVNDLMEKMGFTEEMMENMEKEINELMGMNMIEPVETNDSDRSQTEDGFVPGGAATFPFLKSIFPGAEQQEPAIRKRPRMKIRFGQRFVFPPEKKDKRKNLGLYCNNLTARAKTGNSMRL